MTCCEINLLFIKKKFELKWFYYHTKTISHNYRLLSDIKIFVIKF